MVSYTAWVQVHIFVEPLDLPGIARVAVVAEMAGAAFGVWQAQERGGAQITNGPGVWSMSVLDPSGMKGAKESCGEVFGWNADAMGEMTLWRLPSYVRGRPGQPVPRDVVGVMVPANNEQSQGDTPSNGSVDLWTLDVDAGTNKAVGLDGKVAVPPFGSPCSRDAVPAGLQGAVFTVSKVTRLRRRRDEVGQITESM